MAIFAGIGRLERAPVLAIAFAAVLLSAGQAGAQSCTELRAHLASASRGGGQTEAVRLDRAIRQQQRNLARAAAAAEAPSCSGLFGGFKAQCADARRAATGLRQNINSLRAARAAIGRSDSRTVRRLQDAMVRAGCTAGREPARAAPRRESQPTAVSASRSAMPARGNFRTLCVRTCDGYFFPISHQSSRQTFERDAAACQSLCPGTQVELFYHRVPQDESADMVSIRDDRPYTELPNAFDYRRADFKRPEGCSCTATSGPKGFTVIAGNPPGAGLMELPGTAKSAAPADEPSPSISAVMGSLRGTATVEPKAPVRVTNTASFEDRAVRVVGPIFLPDQ